MEPGLFYAKIYVLKDYKLLNQMPTLRQVTLQYKHQRKKMQPSYGIQTRTNEGVKP